ncbi:MAG: hypothetical protein KTR28_00860 [Micavibrio sp.]|nr:hypothetical protein [Micavibrio sp.]
MSGLIEGYEFDFFASEHETESSRTSRKLTAIEVILKNRPPIDFLLASGIMVAISKHFDIKGEWKPAHKAWSEAWVALSPNERVMEVYLDERRLGIITKLMNVKNANILIINKNDSLILRMDIADPLMAIDRLEKIKAMLQKTAQILELREGESNFLKVAETKVAAMNIALAEDDEGFTTDLRLEDDEHEENAQGDEEGQGDQDDPNPQSSSENPET